MYFIRAVYYFFWRRYRGCWRKVKHVSKSSAEREAQRIGGGVHAYRCPYCRQWHVGHSSRHF